MRLTNHGVINMLPFTDRGGVAQLAEQRNHNPRVRGSSPFAATRQGHRFFGALFCVRSATNAAGRLHRYSA